jgi:hypothetical protein
MTRPSRDFKQFARAYPALPPFRIALTYAEREVRRRGHIPPDTGFMLTYVIWADLTQNGRKYSEDQPRVPAGQPGGGQWTSGDGGGEIVDTTDSLVEMPIQFVSIEWGMLIAELRPAFGHDGRLCVYQFGDQTVIVPGPNNFSCQPKVAWPSTWHGQILNDNVRRSF